MFERIFEALKIYLNNDIAVWFFLTVWIPAFIYWLLCFVREGCILFKKD